MFIISGGGFIFKTKYVFGKLFWCLYRKTKRINVLCCGLLDKHRFNFETLLKPVTLVAAPGVERVLKEV
jgi:hypothetical protein